MEIIGGILVACMALLCLVFSIRQFKHKGAPLNNAFLYASSSEREKMDKAPYYKQSGIVFALLTGTFSFLSAELLTEAKWLSYPAGILIAIVIVYAVASTVIIEKRKS